MIQAAAAMAPAISNSHAHHELPVAAGVLASDGGVEEMRGRMASWCAVGWSTRAAGV
jgi:hypothetical protein